jgi:hypothetical protein
MKNEARQSPMTFTDRLVSGFLCTLLVAVTLGAYLFFLFILLGRWSESIFRAVSTVFFSSSGIFVIVGSFIAGFVAGPDRVATGLSFLWGTHPIWKQEKWRARAVVFFLLLAFVYMLIEYHLHDLRYHQFR